VFASCGGADSISLFLSRCVALTRAIISVGMPRSGYDLNENMPVAWHYMEGFKYKAWTNEFGGFDTPYNGEKDYILLLGDSFTFDLRAFDCKFGTLMEKYLGTAS